MIKRTFQELLAIYREEGILSLKDASSVIKDLVSSSDPDFEESDYSQSPWKKIRELARLIKDESLIIHADSNDFHNLAVDYARLNMYDCAVWVLERGFILNPYAPDLLADMILYGTESGQRAVCKKAYSNLIHLDRDSWGVESILFYNWLLFRQSEMLSKRKNKRKTKRENFFNGR